MSTLLLNTLTGKTSAGSIVVTGEGGSTTTNLQQGLAKGWIYFDPADSNAVRDSFNMSFVTDEGTGEYMVGITNDMGSVTYVVHVTGSTNHSGSVDSDTQAAGQYSIEFDEDGDGSRGDVNMAYTSILGDLA